MECIRGYFASNGIRLANDQEKFFREQFLNINLVDLPKVFKMSIAQFFSKENKQELPDIDGISVKLFTKKQFEYLRKKYNNPTRKARILFGLLQCKDLAYEVPKEMIKAAYEKHRKVLATVASTRHENLEFLRSYARQFAGEVKRHYTNVTIPLAKTKAPYERTRAQGGIKGELERCLVFNHKQRIHTKTRMDPVVIHLIGPPGSGKSYLSEILISKIAQAFGISKQNARYSRSMATEHWDGYRNQLIAQIDDIFTERDSTDDAKQIIQMCSNAQWVVPMADLKDKGREFNSEFVILSSNNRFQRGSYINNDAAIDRRIYNPAFQIERRGTENVMFVMNVDSNSHHTLKPGMTIHGSRAIIDFIMNYALKTYDERLTSLETIDNVSYRHNFVPIVSGKEFQFNAGYKFDLCPNSIPRVKAHAIPEPLKVRMITKGEAQNYILKPLQKAMFKAMKSFPVFRLTSGQCILNNFKQTNDSRYVLVSGDYEAATDNLHSDVMRTVVSELVKVLPPSIIPYVLRESGQHIVEYPDWTHLEPVLQTNGQLMGSLLSFPILCVANAATYGNAIGCEDLKDLPALINGDDIGFRDTLAVVRKWKRIAKDMGLKPSLGKNYISKDWFTINSQFCEYRKHNHTIKVRPSEAYSVLFNHKARKGYIDTIRPACERFPKPLVVKYLKSKLLQTPRSIDIPVKYGGLGPNKCLDESKVTLQDRYVNLQSYLKGRVEKLQQIEEFVLVKMPVKMARNLMDFDVMSAAAMEGQYPPKAARPIYENRRIIPTFQEVVPENSEHDIDEWREFRRFKKFVQTVPELRNWIKSNQPLFSTNEVKTCNIWVYLDIYNQLPKHNLV